MKNSLAALILLAGAGAQLATAASASQIPQRGHLGASTLLISTRYMPGVAFGELGFALGLQDTGVTFVSREFDFYADEWVSTKTYFASSVIGLDSIGVSGSTFLVTSKSGANDVLELWTIFPPQGAYHASRILSTATPLGTPVETPPLHIEVFGGEYIAPSLRAGATSVTVPVYSGSHLGGIGPAVADPDGRFVIAVGAANKDLFRISLHDGSVSTMLTHSAYPMLSTVNNLEVVHHPQYGRVYVVIADEYGNHGGVRALFLHDQSNDGMIDYVQTNTEAEYYASSLYSEADDDYFRAKRQPSIGVTFCYPTDPNSTGMATVLSGTLGANTDSSLHLEAYHGVPGQYGYVLIGTNPSDPGIVSGDGHFCLAVGGTDSFGRYNVYGGDLDSIGPFDSAGVLQNLTNTSTVGSGYDVPLILPIPGYPNGTILAGDTWHFQLWYRSNGTGASNYSNGLSVMF